PTAQVPTVVDVVLDDVLSTAATNSGLRLVQSYANGSMPYSAFASQWQALLTSAAQSWATPNPGGPNQDSTGAGERGASGDSATRTTPAPARRPVPAGRRAGRAARRRRRYRWLSIAAGGVIVAMTYFPIIFVVSNSLKTGKNIFTSGVFSLFTQFDYEN